MFRFIIDTFSDGHHDIFLKIDARPGHLSIADTYFLGDFLEIDEVEFDESGLGDEGWVRFKAIKLIEYWVEQVHSLKKGEKKFISFDLSDQYVKGIMIEKVKLGFKFSIVYTEQLYGWDITKSTLDEQINNQSIHFIDHEKQEWLVGEDAFFAGLEWSKNELIR